MRYFSVFLGGVALAGLFIAPSSARDLYNYQTGQAQNNSGTVQYNQPYQNQRGATETNSNPKSPFYSGAWSLTLGATAYSAPEYQGSDSYKFKLSPIISLGKTGVGPRFVSRNDNISFSLYDNGPIRLGLAGKILWERDSGDSDDLKGLHKVKWGGEAGGFMEIYPVDGLRLRGEWRHGIRTHSAVTADIAIDAYRDLTPTLRLSGGPRAFYGGKDYFKTYYGVNERESIKSGLSQYDADSGWGSFGFGGALTWQTTPKLTTSIFAEYNRLTGPAGDSSLVEDRGDKNQLTIGISASYRFDFNL